MVGELAPGDLETYSKGRLKSSDDATKDLLAAALAYLRNYCRWHVTPVETVSGQTTDGPGQWGGLQVGIGGMYGASGEYVNTLRRPRYGAETLYLPTKYLLGISSIIEDGVELAPRTDFVWSTSGAVQKTSGQPWSSSFQGITATYTHGYSEEEAADWRRLVLAMADRMSMVRGLLGPFNSTIGPYRVGAYFGESRTGNLPSSASWLDDLLAQVASDRYVRFANI